MLKKPKHYARCLFVPIFLVAGCFGQPAVENSHTADGSGSAPAASANLFGVTKGPEGAPLAGVRVVIHNLEDGSERVVQSDTAGAFAAPDLKPGRYQLT